METFMTREKFTQILSTCGFSFRSPQRGSQIAGAYLVMTRSNCCGPNKNRSRLRGNRERVYRPAVCRLMIHSINHMPRKQFITCCCFFYLIARRWFLSRCARTKCRRYFNRRANFVVHAYLNGNFSSSMRNAIKSRCIKSTIDRVTFIYATNYFCLAAFNQLSHRNSSNGENYFTR